MQHKAVFGYAITLVALLGCASTTTPGADAKSGKDIGTAADGAPPDTAVPEAPAGMVLIPAGPSWMGCVPGDADCSFQEKPQHQVHLEAYYLDAHEVTAAAYRGCVEAGKCTAPASTGLCSADSRGTYGAAGKEEHPVNCVTWDQAEAFCKWTGGRLPTEAEWEKAARGGLVNKKFPWGDEDPTCTPGQANTAVWGAGGQGGCGKNMTWPVGTGSAKNGFGLSDMAGNVSEWVNDWHDKNYYGNSPAANPLGPASGSDRIRRGAGFYHLGPAAFRVSSRDHAAPTGGFEDAGLRCARSVP